MVFNSYTFAVFLPIVLVAYWRLRHRQQNVLLLVASYLFYGWWDPRFLLLMWFTTAVDFFVGRRMGVETDDRRRRGLLVASLVVNLGTLALFKYFDFFVESASDLLRSVGLEANPPALRLLLPVGISFYTFHGISYTVDVYRRRVPPVADPVVFGAFVSYFPQLVAGPIGRAEVQLPQFEQPRPRPRRDEVIGAIFTIFMGFAKKIVIADALASSVRETFDDIGPRSSWSLLLGVYAFALQIYGDFAGYTDIARGVSRLFGIELPENFRQPYLSGSVTEFWRRWHISLSSWLRDYVYIPLGGNRGSEITTVRNLFLTMLLGGLWHGAAWTFVAWGAIHGGYLVIERVWSRSFPRRAEGVGPAWWRLARIVGTFHLVCFAWIFFRAESMGQAGEMISGIASLRSGATNWNLVLLLMLTATIALAFDLSQRSVGRDDALRRWPSVLQGSFVGAVLVLFVVFSGGPGETFIYFRF